MLQGLCGLEADTVGRQLVLRRPLLWDVLHPNSCGECGVCDLFTHCQYHFWSNSGLSEALWTIQPQNNLPRCEGQGLEHEYPRNMPSLIKQGKFRPPNSIWTGSLWKNILRGKNIPFLYALTCSLKWYNPNRFAILIKWSLRSYILKLRLFLFLYNCPCTNPIKILKQFIPSMIAL